VKRRLDPAIRTLINDIIQSPVHEGAIENLRKAWANCVHQNANESYKIPVFATDTGDVDETVFCRYCLGPVYVDSNECLLECGKV